MEIGDSASDSPGRLCGYCGNSFAAAAKRGRPAAYCSPDCRKRAANARKVTKALDAMAGEAPAAE